MTFDFIASTGRTATTHIAHVLNTADDVCACHEGYIGSGKEQAPLLPLINLDNAQSYASPAAAAKTVAAKRNPDLLRGLAVTAGRSRLIDVAYYNATIATELLRQNPQSQMIGIIRDCEGFVRSATTLTGEDPLPVGWPDPAKPLTDREKFIAMGRIRPARGTGAHAEWQNWGAIARNIWLWHETNLLLLQAKAEFPGRVHLCRFRTFQSTPDVFWNFVKQSFEIPHLNPPIEKTALNKKPGGYQVGPKETWHSPDYDAMINCQKLIDERARYEC